MSGRLTESGKQWLDQLNKFQNFELAKEEAPPPSHTRPTGKELILFA